MGAISIISISVVVISAQVVLPFNSDKGCQPGAYRFQGFCYSYVQTPQPFNKANETCSGRGGTLATIKDHETARFIRAFHRKMTALSYWIGLSDRNSEGIWMYISDNSTIGYQNWNGGEPNDADKNQDCALIRIDIGLTWDDHCCCKKFLYICQFEDTSKHCRDNNRLKENCYELFRQRVKFREAENICKNMGGKLAEIKTISEQRFLEERIQQETWWIYLTDLQMDQFDDWNYGAWIGIYKARGKWIYSDGSIVNEPLWKSGQPSDKENADCALVADQWMSNTCDKLYSSICQFEADLRPTIIVNDTQTAPPVNDDAGFPTVLVATIISAIAIIVCLIIVFIIIYYRRIVRVRLESQLQLPPPVPRREEMEPNFRELRAISFYSASDGYLIAQDPMRLQPRNDSSHAYLDVIDNDDSYASVNENRMMQYTK